MSELREHLTKLGACGEALEWIGERTARQAWEECERPEWLLWWAGRTPANSHQQIVRAACACARTALQYAPAGDERPRLAIEAAERWADDPTPQNIQAAMAAGRDAALAAREAGWAAREAGWAAGRAADAAAWAGRAAMDAAWAARAARDAWEAGWAANTAARAEMCALVRSILSQPWS